MPSNGNSAIDVFLIEDNISDVELALEAFSEVAPSRRIAHAEDADQAMEMLARTEMRPRLIVLDLNLPRKDGREVLAELKANPRLRLIPVVVFTTSHADSDVRRCYDLYANCYLQKPLDFTGLVETIRALDHFWLRLAVLPDE